MTVFFANSSPLDLNALTTLGVSVKTGDNPIGYFGTGLKFAIATLLRTGHRVRIWISGKEHVLGLASIDVRGTAFSVITLDDQKLGFTTALGKNWEVWQAYRELASNAMDEERHAVTDQRQHGKGWDTLIEVQGPAILAVYHNREKVFTTAPIVSETKNVRARAGANTRIYYRSVCALVSRSPALYTWDILEPQRLTEDRTLANAYDIYRLMGECVAGSHNEDFIETCVLAGTHTLEAGMDFPYWGPTPTFLAVVKRNLKHRNLLEAARNYWVAHAPAYDPYEDASLDAQDHTDWEAAIRLCLLVDSSFDQSPRFVKTLGENCFGRYSTKDGVLISHACFAMGVDFLAATLYEEYLHEKHSYEDESRNLQNYLFQQLIRLAKRAR